MKAVLFFLITLLFTGCITLEPKPKIYPQWYKNREICSTVKYELIGYGQGRSIKEAEANAKESIALTLLSKIDSSFKSTSTNDSSSSEAKLKVTSRLNFKT